MVDMDSSNSEQPNCEDKLADDFVIVHAKCLGRLAQPEMIHHRSLHISIEHFRDRQLLSTRVRDQRARQRQSAKQVAKVKLGAARAADKGRGMDDVQQRLLFTLAKS